MTRYFLEYISDEIAPCHGTYNHLIGDYDKHLHGDYYGNSMRTMKNYISKIKREKAQYHPRAFRIYDLEAPDEPDGHAGQVYFEQYISEKGEILP